MQQLTAVLFDLDGTLIDSIELIVRSMAHTLRQYEKPVPPRETLVSGIGIPLRTHLLRYAAHEEEADAMVTEYRTWNRKHHDEWVRPFEGVAAALDRVAARGLRTAVVTSKLQPDAERGLAHCGLDGRFELVIGPEATARHKPDGEPLLHTCERLGVPPAEAAYVGDSVHDMHAAVAAGTRAIGAGWGPFPTDALRQAGADPVLARPDELEALR